jgi:hypothetical protein
LVLPETERVAARVIVLPTGEEVSEDMVATICEIIHVAFLKAPELRSVLEGRQPTAPPQQSR